jgi:hypothetical protein
LPVDEAAAPGPARGHRDRRRAARIDLTAGADSERIEEVSTEIGRERRELARATDPRRARATDET